MLEELTGDTLYTKKNILKRDLTGKTALRIEGNK